MYLGVVPSRSAKYLQWLDQGRHLRLSRSIVHVNRNEFGVLDDLRDDPVVTELIRFDVFCFRHLIASFEDARLDSVIDNESLHVYWLGFVQCGAHA